jgi:uncharacterized membrane protein
MEIGLFLFGLSMSLLVCLRDKNCTSLICGIVLITMFEVIASFYSGTNYIRRYLMCSVFGCICAIVLYVLVKKFDDLK